MRNRAAAGYEIEAKEWTPSVAKDQFFEKFKQRAEDAFLGLRALQDYKIHIKGALGKAPGKLRVCAAGGGPGSDLVGVCRALRSIYPSVEISATIADLPCWAFDSQPGGSVRDAILEHKGALGIVSIEFVKTDLVAKDAALPEADIYVFSWVLWEIRKKQEHQTRRERYEPKSDTKKLLSGLKGKLFVSLEGPFAVRNYLSSHFNELRYNWDRNRKVTTTLVKLPDPRGAQGGGDEEQPADDPAAPAE